MPKRTSESAAFLYLKKGEYFFSTKADRHSTALANYYGRKVKTERMIAVSTDTSTPFAENVTKVIFLDDPKQPE